MRGFFVMDWARFFPRHALILAAVAVGGFAQNSADNRQLSIHLSTATSSFVSGAEIELNLDVTNLSDHRLLIPARKHKPEEGGFEFSIARIGAPIGSQVQMTNYLWAVIGNRAPRQNVKDPDERLSLITGGNTATDIPEGGTIRFTALLNNLYDMTSPRAYSIQVRKLPNYGPEIGSPDAEPFVAVESNTITVTVTEPPPPTIALLITATAQTSTAQSEIDADVAVTNISATSISLPLDSNNPGAELNGYRLIAFRTDTKLDAAVKSIFDYGWRDFGQKYPLQATVQPNQSLHYPAKLTSLLDMSAPGSYIIHAETPDPITHLTVKSNALTIVVQ